MPRMRLDGQLEQQPRISEVIVLLYLREDKLHKHKKTHVTKLVFTACSVCDVIQQSLPCTELIKPIKQVLSPVRC